MLCCFVLLKISSIFKLTFFLNEQKACLHHKHVWKVVSIYEVHFACLSLWQDKNCSVTCPKVCELWAAEWVCPWLPVQIDTARFIFKYERLHCELIYLLIEQIWQHRILKLDKWNCDHVCSFICLFSHWQQHNQLQPPQGCI